MKRHHDQLPQREILNWDGSLTVSEGAWQHIGTQGTGNVAESPTSCRQQEVDGYTELPVS